MTRAESDRHVVIRHAVLFIAGFTTVFIVEGATASAVGSVLVNYRDVITRVVGAIVILLGLSMLGLFRLSALAMDRRLRLRGNGYAGSLVAGIGFAAGWTPCVGPVLSAVLAMAASAATLSQGMWLLFVYSMGLAVPFIALALGFDSVLRLFTAIKRFLPLIEAAAGALVIATGIVLVTNSFVRVLGWLYGHFPLLAAAGLGPETVGGTVSVGAAFVAGLVSCISPCVFPLIPAYLSLISGQSFEQLMARRAMVSVRS